MVTMFPMAVGFIWLSTKMWQAIRNSAQLSCYDPLQSFGIALCDTMCARCDASSKLLRIAHRITALLRARVLPGMMISNITLLRAPSTHHTFA